MNKIMKKKGIDIRDDQEVWLQEHEEVNLSGLVRKALDDLMAREKKDFGERKGGEGRE